MITLTKDQARTMRQVLQTGSDGAGGKESDGVLHSLCEQLSARRFGYTPGPWRRQGLEVWTCDGILIAGCSRSRTIRKYEMHANANLLSQAPAFLEWAETWLHAPSDDNGHIEDLCTIVKKAWGE